MLSSATVAMLMHGAPATLPLPAKPHALTLISHLSDKWLTVTYRNCVTGARLTDRVTRCPALIEAFRPGRSADLEKCGLLTNYGEVYWFSASAGLVNAVHPENIYAVEAA